MRSTLLSVVVLALLAPGSAFATPVVSAFYYPWFGTSIHNGGYQHWAQGGHAPPNDIASVYYPAVGVYSSADAALLAQQMHEINRAGIDEIAVSWWGRGSPEDQRFPAILAAAAKEHVAVAIHLEPYGGRTVSSTSADIDYLTGLGVTKFYVYQAFQLPAGDWAPINDALRLKGIVTYAQTPFVGQAATGHFSGVYTYDILTWGSGKFSRICAEAHAAHLLCAPSVGPGFDAKRTNANLAVKPRRRGLTYDTMWNQAIAAGADDITITSFNEWQEGTQIEPAAPPKRRGDIRYGSYNGAWGLFGRKAATAYLDRTGYWAHIFRRAVAKRSIAPS
ncbi:MAG: alpha-mannosidase [Actinomycetes bacterium]